MNNLGSSCSLYPPRIKTLASLHRPEKISNGRFTSQQETGPPQLFEDFIKANDDLYEYEENEYPLETDRTNEFVSRRWDEKRCTNKTFSETQLREIDRDNSLLLGKIMHNNKRQNQYKNAPRPSVHKMTSAAINRKREQKKIDSENLRLLQKIQSVKPFGLSRRKN